MTSPATCNRIVREMQDLVSELHERSAARVQRSDRRLPWQMTSRRQLDTSAYLPNAGLARRQKLPIAPLGGCRVGWLRNYWPFDRSPLSGGRSSAVEPAPARHVVGHVGQRGRRLGERDANSAARQVVQLTGQSWAGAGPVGLNRHPTAQRIRPLCPWRPLQPAI